MQCCKSSGFSYFRCGGLTDAAHPLFGSIVLVLQMESEWPGFQLARKIENALSTEVDRQQRIRCMSSFGFGVENVAAGTRGARVESPEAKHNAPRRSGLTAKRRALPDREPQPNMRAIELRERALAHEQDQPVA